MSTGQRLPEFADLHPRYQALASAFVAFLRAHGLRVTVTSVLRSGTTQARLYAEYQAARRAGRPHLPAAAPGHSLHERGLAWDMDVQPRQYLPVAGHIWTQLGGRWGGSFHDPVHFDFGLNPLV